METAVVDSVVHDEYFLRGGSRGMCSLPPVC